MKKFAMALALVAGSLFVAREAHAIGIPTTIDGVSSGGIISGYSVWDAVSGADGYWVEVSARVTDEDGHVRTVRLDRFWTTVPGFDFSYDDPGARGISVVIDAYGPDGYIDHGVDGDSNLSS